MTTVADRNNPLEFNLQPTGATGLCYYAPVLSHLDEIARNVFAHATPCSVLVVAHHGAQPQFHGGGSAEPTTPVTEKAQTDDPILRAIDDLKSWLNVSYDELARILGWQTASNIYYWRRCAQANEPIRPRASSTEPILRLHTLLQSVTEVLSGNDSRAVELWSRTPSSLGGVTPLQLLQEGRLDLVERQAASLLFDGTPTDNQAWRRIRPDDSPEDLAVTEPIQDYDAADFG
jgi:hypothetical protein